MTPDGTTSISSVPGMHFVPLPGVLTNFAGGMPPSLAGLGVSCGWDSAVT